VSVWPGARSVTVNPATPKSLSTSTTVPAPKRLPSPLVMSVNAAQVRPVMSARNRQTARAAQAMAAEVRRAGSGDMEDRGLGVGTQGSALDAEHNLVTGALVREGSPNVTCSLET